MSRQVDERVVSMRFDNRNFEQNVQTTLGTIDKLKNSLNFKGATKSLENIDSAAKKVDMSSLGGAVEKVGLKFNALYAMADQAFRNITNSAYAAGKKIVSALAIDPITTGFSEYETKMGAIQTIMSNTASKGTTMQDVTRVINELNTYADKTIYNFAEMTKNIGTFTAAGVGLEESAAAIQGIANLAAASGSTSQQASTAMYQLSQALSSGTVKLMDWNSVVNAGMGGEKFQEALKATAREHGVAIDNIIKKNGSFRESLQEGWLSADILNETLQKFTVEGAKEYAQSMVASGKYTQEQADALIKEAQAMEDAATKVKTFTQLCDTMKESAQSGWAQTWEIIVGDFDEAKALFTEISDTIGGMIGASAEARNNVLNGALSTGWKQLLSQGIDDAAGFEETVTKVAKDHGINIDEMIKAEGSFQETLKNGWLDGDILTESISAYTDKLSGMSDEELKAAGYTRDMVDKMVELRKQVDAGTLSMEEFADKIAKPSGRELLIESLWNAFKGLMSVIEPIKDAFRDIFPATTSEQLYKLIEGIRNFTANMKLNEEQSDKLRRTFRGVFAVLDIAVQIVKAIINGFVKLVNYMSPATEGLLGFSASVGDFLVSVRDAAKQSNIFNKIIEAIGKVIVPVIEGVKMLGREVSEAFDGMADKFEVRFEPLKALGTFLKAIFVGIGKIIAKLAPGFAKMASVVGGVFDDFASGISDAIQNSDYNALFDIFTTGVFASILLGIKKFISSATNITDNAGGFLENVKEILGGLKDSLNAFTQSIKAKTLKTIAVAIAILAGSLLVLSLIDSDKLASSLAAITTLFIELFGSMAMFDKISKDKGFKTLTKVTSAMISLSFALLVLSVALKIMSTMSWDDIGRGLTVMTAGIYVLVKAVSSLPENDIKKAASAISKLAKTLIVLAIALKIMATMTWDEIARGLTAMTVSLGLMVGAVNLLPEENVKKAASAIFTLSVSMVVLAAALTIMSSMSWEEIGRGLTTLVGGLAAMIAASHLLPKDMALKALGMITFATALVILASALKIMGSMSWEELSRGLIVLAASLGMIIGTMKLLKKALSGAAALLIIANSLLVLSIALKIMGSMSWEEIARGLVALAGAFTVIGVAGLLLKPLAGTLIKIGAAVLVFGIGLLAAGAGVLMFSAGLTALAVSASSIAGAIVLIISSIISLIPYIIEQIGVGIVKLCLVIANSADAIVSAIITILLAVIRAINTVIPDLVECIFNLIVTVLQALVQYTPTIVGSIMDFLIALIRGIAEKMPDLIKAGVDLLMSIFVGIVEALEDIDPEILVKGLLGVGFLSALMLALAAIGALAPAAMVGVVAAGAVIAELALMLSAMGLLAKTPGLETLVEEGGELLEKVGTAIGKFIGGLIGGIGEGMSGSLPQIGTDLSQFMTNAKPFIEGAKLIDAQAMAGVKNLAETMLILTASNLLDSLTSWLTGGASLAEFGAELAAFGPYMKQYADSVAGIDAEAVKASAEAAKALTDMASNIPNTGGLVAKVTGDNDIGEFGKKLPGFGESMAKYGEYVKNIDSDKIKASAEAAKAIVDFAKDIPNNGGLAAFFAGDNDLAEFAPKIETFGWGLHEYGNWVKDLNCEQVKKSAEAAKSIVDFAKDVPNNGGLAAFFAGDNDLASFGWKMADFGAALSNYSWQIRDCNTDKMRNVLWEAWELTHLARGAADQNDNAADATSFGWRMSEFGSAINAYQSNIWDIDPDKMRKVLIECWELTHLARGCAEANGNAETAKTFAKSIKSFGTNISNFYEEISDIDSSHMRSVLEDAKYLNDLLPTLNGTDSANIDSFASSVKHMIDTVVTTIAASAETLKAAGGKIMTNVLSGITAKASSPITMLTVMIAMTSVVSALKLSYTNFYDAGSYVVSGFVSGMTNETTLATVTAAGTKIGKYALNAAKKALDENSPSKKFAEVGKFTVAGLVKGITDNLKMADKSGVELGNRLLEATQDNLGIHSPSIVFDEKVGRYIVQGIAEGIKSDMSAEEAAEKKAQNIVDAFRKVFDRNDTKVEIGDKEFELWGLTDGKYATAAEKQAKELSNAQSTLAVLNENKQLALSEWEETKKHLGAESDEAKKAYGKYVDTLIAIEKQEETVSEINKRSYDRTREYRDEYVDDTLGNIDSRATAQDTWKLTHGLYASESEILQRELDDLEKDWLDLNNALYEAEVRTNEAKARLSTLVKGTEEYKEAEEDYNTCLIEQADIENQMVNKSQEIRDKRKEWTQILMDDANARIESNDLEYENWLARFPDAKDVEKDAKNTKRLSDNLKEQENINAQLEANFNDLFAKHNGDMNHDDVRAAHQEWISGLTAATNIRNEIDQIAEDALERERQSLETQYSLASENADLRYQIWETTAGKNATSYEKNVMKIGVLTQKLQSEEASLNIAQQRWAEAAAKYGENSNEAQAAYKEYLDKALSIANLQNEIEDINKSTVEKQKLAKSSYNDYLEKYRKYYLENNMTLEQLEKDARLVSGFDPNAKLENINVDEIVANADKAIASVNSNPAYKSVIEGCNDLGQSYITSVNDGIKSKGTLIVDSMADTGDEVVDVMGEKGEDAAESMILSFSSIFDKKSGEFTEIGENIVKGIIAGMTNESSSLYNFLQQFFGQTTQTSKDELEINSPSRVFAEIGKYVVAGFANGITENLDTSDEAMSAMANSAIGRMRDTISRISDMVDSDIDTQPTIRPVLDLSNVEAGTARLNSMFSTSQAYAISAGMRPKHVEENQNGDKSSDNSGKTVQFNQYNYSPKALSAVEIYRRTKNQLTAMTEVLK